MLEQCLAHLRQLLSQLFLDLAPLKQHFVVSSLLLIMLIDVDALSEICLFLLLFDLFHQLTDLGLKTLLELSVVLPE